MHTVDGNFIRAFRKTPVHKTRQIYRISLCKYTDSSVRCTVVIIVLFFVTIEIFINLSRNRPEFRIIQLIFFLRVCVFPVDFLKYFIPCIVVCCFICFVISWTVCLYVCNIVCLRVSFALFCLFYRRKQHCSDCCLIKSLCQKRIFNLNLKRFVKLFFEFWVKFTCKSRTKFTLEFFIELFFCTFQIVFFDICLFSWRNCGK